MKRFLRKTTALVTACLFLLGEMSLPYAAPAPSVFPVSEVSARSPFHLELPPELGTITRLHSGSGPVLIHLQTAHGNFDAQKKIESILHHLQNTYGIDLVFLEGSAAPIESERIRFFPGKMDLTMEVLDLLAQEALVKGPELFLAKSETAKAYGIENLEAYRENVQSFREVLEAADKSKQFLQDMDMQIERLSSPYLNSKLKSFLKEWERFEKQNASFQEWLSFLKTQAIGHLEMDIAHPRYQVDWPMLFRMLKLLELETKIDREKVSEESFQFLEALKKTKIPQEMFQEVKRHLELPLSHHQLPDPETGLFFEKVAGFFPEGFNTADYPQLSFFIGHLILQSEIKGARLFEESEAMAQKVAVKLARDEHEKNLIVMLQDYQLLKKLFSLELTPGDFDQIRARQNEIRPGQILKRFSALNKEKRVRNLENKNFNGLEDLFDRAFRFYEGTSSRDTAMLSNIEKVLKESGKSKAVVITGGFHANPFERFFKTKNYNYAQITPSLSNVDGRETYIRSMIDYQTAASSTVESVSFAGLSRAELIRHGVADPENLETHFIVTAFKPALLHGVMGMDQFLQLLAQSPRFNNVSIRYAKNPQGQDGFLLTFLSADGNTVLKQVWVEGKQIKQEIKVTTLGFGDITVTVPPVMIPVSTNVKPVQAASLVNPRSETREAKDAVRAARQESALSLFNRTPLLKGYTPKSLEATLKWLQAHRSELEDYNLGFFVEAFSAAGRLPEGANKERWKRIASAYDFYLGNKLLRSHTPKDLRTTLVWLRKNRALLDGNSLSYLVEALSAHGQLPEGENAEMWKRAASAYDFYLSNKRLRSYKPKKLRTTLEWLRKNRALLDDNSLSYLVEGLSAAGRLPESENAEKWKRAASAYDFYLSNERLQSYEPRDLRATLAWLHENHAALAHNSFSYLMEALHAAGRLPPDANIEVWQRAAGAYAHAMKDRNLIEDEIRRIWTQRLGEGESRATLARLKKFFDENKLLNLKTGKPLSRKYRGATLNYAYDLYGSKLIQELESQTPRRSESRQMDFSYEGEGLGKKFRGPFEKHIRESNVYANVLSVHIKTVGDRRLMKFTTKDGLLVSFEIAGHSVSRRFLERMDKNFKTNPSKNILARISKRRMPWLPWVATAVISLTVGLTLTFNGMRERQQVPALNQPQISIDLNVLDLSTLAPDARAIANRLITITSGIKDPEDKQLANLFIREFVKNPRIDKSQLSALQIDIVASVSLSPEGEVEYATINEELALHFPPIIVEKVMIHEGVHVTQAESVHEFSRLSRKFHEETQQMAQAVGLERLEEILRDPGIFSDGRRIMDLDLEGEWEAHRKEILSFLRTVEKSGPEEATKLILEGLGNSPDDQRRNAWALKYLYNAVAVLDQNRRPDEKVMKINLLKNKFETAYENPESGRNAFYMIFIQMAYHNMRGTPYEGTVFIDREHVQVRVADYVKFYEWFAQLPRSESRVSDFSDQQSLSEYIRQVQKMERRIADLANDPNKLRQELYSFIRNFMHPDDLGDKDKALGVDHTLWRMFQNPLVRAQAIDIARLKSSGGGVRYEEVLNLQAHVLLIDILGRFFSQDQKARDYLIETADFHHHVAENWTRERQNLYFLRPLLRLGIALTVYHTNEYQIEKARAILKNPPQLGAPPAREEDLRHFQITSIDAQSDTGGEAGDANEKPEMALDERLIKDITSTGVYEYLTDKLGGDLSVRKTRSNEYEVKLLIKKWFYRDHYLEEQTLPLYMRTIEEVGKGRYHTANLKYADVDNYRVMQFTFDITLSDQAERAVRSESRKQDTAGLKRRLKAKFGELFSDQILRKAQTNGNVYLIDPSRKKVAKRLSSKSPYIFRLIPPKGEDDSGRFIKLPRRLETRDERFPEIEELLELNRNGPFLDAPQLIAIGLTDQGKVWMELEAIENAVDLNRALSQKWMTLEKMWSALIRAAQIVQSVHLKHMVHRDIKPANILVNPKGQVMIIDFGAAGDAATQAQIHTKGFDPDDSIAYASYDIYSLIVTINYMIDKALRKFRMLEPEVLLGLAEAQQQYDYWAQTTKSESARFKRPLMTELIAQLRSDAIDLGLSRSEMREWNKQGVVYEQGQMYINSQRIDQAWSFPVDLSEEEVAALQPLLIRSQSEDISGLSSYPSDMLAALTRNHNSQSIQKLIRNRFEFIQKNSPQLENPPLQSAIEKVILAMPLPDLEADWYAWHKPDSLARWIFDNVVGDSGLLAKKYAADETNNIDQQAREHLAQEGEPIREKVKAAAQIWIDFAKDFVKDLTPTIRDLDEADEYSYERNGTYLRVMQFRQRPITLFEFSWRTPVPEDEEGMYDEHAVKVHIKNGMVTWFAPFTSKNRITSPISSSGMEGFFKRDILYVDPETEEWKFAIHSLEWAYEDAFRAKRGQLFIDDDQNIQFRQTADTKWALRQAAKKIRNLKKQLFDLIVFRDWNQGITILAPKEMGLDSPLDIAEQMLQTIPSFKEVVMSLQTGRLEEVQQLFLPPPSSDKAKRSEMRKDSEKGPQQDRFLSKILRLEGEKAPARTRFWIRLTQSAILIMLADVAARYLGWPGLVDVYRTINESIPALGGTPMGKFLTTGFIASLSGAITDRFTMLYTDNPTHQYKPLLRSFSLFATRFILGGLFFPITFVSKQFFPETSNFWFVRTSISFLYGVAIVTILGVYFNGWFARAGLQAQYARGALSFDNFKAEMKNFSQRVQWGKAWTALKVRLPAVIALHLLAQHIVGSEWTEAAFFTFGPLFNVMRSLMDNAKKATFSLKVYFWFNSVFFGGVFLWGVKKSIFDHQPELWEKNLVLTSVAVASFLAIGVIEKRREAKAVAQLAEKEPARDVVVPQPSPGGESASERSEMRQFHGINVISIQELKGQFGDKFMDQRFRLSRDPRFIVNEAGDEYARHLDEFHPNIYKLLQPSVPQQDFILKVAGNSDAWGTPVGIFAGGAAGTQALTQGDVLLATPNEEILEEAKSLLVLQKTAVIPGIPQVHNLGILEDGRLFVVIETVKDGLALDVFNEEDEEIAIEVLWEGFISLAKTLKEIHRREMLHNDIKPANILLSDDGRMQLIDFNAAVPIGTRSDWGTDGFKPSDQVRREDSDIYSFMQTLITMINAQMELADDEPLNELLKMVLVPYQKWVKGPRQQRPTLSRLMKQLEEDAKNLGIFPRSETREEARFEAEIKKIEQSFNGDSETKNGFSGFFTLKKIEEKNFSQSASPLVLYDPERKPFYFVLRKLSTSKYQILVFQNEDQLESAQDSAFYDFRIASNYSVSDYGHNADIEKGYLPNAIQVDLAIRHRNVASNLQILALYFSKILGHEKFYARESSLDDLKIDLGFTLIEEEPDSRLDDFVFDLESTPLPKILPITLPRSDQDQTPLDLDGLSPATDAEDGRSETRKGAETIEGWKSKTLPVSILKNEFGDLFSPRVFRESFSGKKLFEGWANPVGQALEPEKGSGIYKVTTSEGDPATETFKISRKFLLAPVRPLSEQILGLFGRQADTNIDFTVFNRRLIQEAQILQKFNQAGVAGIPTLKGIGLMSDGRVWIRLAGISNAESLYRRALDSKPIPIEDLWYGFIQVAETIRQMHRNDLLHLDIKPENILIGENGKMQLIDFNLSQPIGTETEAGTPEYLPPEVKSRADMIRREDSDIYSLLRTMEKITLFQIDAWQSTDARYKTLRAIMKTYSDWMQLPKDHRPYLDRVILRLKRDAVKLNLPSRTGIKEIPQFFEPGLSDKEKLKELETAWSDWLPQDVALQFSKLPGSNGGIDDGEQVLRIVFHQKNANGTVGPELLAPGLRPGQTDQIEMSLAVDKNNPYWINRLALLGGTPISRESPELRGREVFRGVLWWLQKLGFEMVHLGRNGRDPYFSERILIIWKGEGRIVDHPESRTGPDKQDEAWFDFHLPYLRLEPAPPARSESRAEDLSEQFGDFYRDIQYVLGWDILKDPSGETVAEQIPGRSFIFRKLSQSSPISEQTFKVSQAPTITENFRLILEAQKLIPLKQKGLAAGFTELLAIGLTQDGRVWLELEGIKDANSLNDILDDKVRVSTPALLKILISAAEILSQAHQGEGVFHFNMRPQTILFNENGNIQLTGFEDAPQLTGLSPQDAGLMASFDSQLFLQLIQILLLHQSRIETNVGVRKFLMAVVQKYHLSSWRQKHGTHAVAMSDIQKQLTEDIMNFFSRSEARQEPGFFEPELADAEKVRQLKQAWSSWLPQGITMGFHHSPRGYTLNGENAGGFERMRVHFYHENPDGTPGAPVIVENIRGKAHAGIILRKDPTNASGLDFVHLIGGVPSNGTSKLRGSEMFREILNWAKQKGFLTVTSPQAHRVHRGQREIGSLEAIYETWQQQGRVIDNPANQNGIVDDGKKFRFDLTHLRLESDFPVRSEMRSEPSFFDAGLNDDEKLKVLTQEWADWLPDGVTVGFKTLAGKILNGENDKDLSVEFRRLNPDGSIGEPMKAVSKDGLAWEVGLSFQKNATVPTEIKEVILTGGLPSTPQTPLTNLEMFRGALYWLQRRGFQTATLLQFPAKTREGVVPGTFLRDAYTAWQKEGRVTESDENVSGPIPGINYFRFHLPSIDLRPDALRQPSEPLSAEDEEALQKIKAILSDEQQIRKEVADLLGHVLNNKIGGWAMIEVLTPQSPLENQRTFTRVVKQDLEEIFEFLNDFSNPKNSFFLDFDNRIGSKSAKAYRDHYPELAQANSTRILTDSQVKQLDEAAHLERLRSPLFEMFFDFQKYLGLLDKALESGRSLQEAEILETRKKYQELSTQVTGFIRELRMSVLDMQHLIDELMVDPVFIRSRIALLLSHSLKGDMSTYAVKLEMLAATKVSERKMKYLEDMIKTSKKIVKDLKKIGGIESQRTFFLTKDLGALGYLLVLPETPAYGHLYEKRRELSEDQMRRVDEVLAETKLFPEAIAAFSQMQQSLERAKEKLVAAGDLEKSDMAQLNQDYENLHKTFHDRMQVQRSETRDEDARGAIAAIVSDPEKIRYTLHGLFQHHLGNKWSTINALGLLPLLKLESDHKEFLRDRLERIRQVRTFLRSFSDVLQDRKFYYWDQFIATPETLGYEVSEAEFGAMDPERKLTLDDVMALDREIGFSNFHEILYRALTLVEREVENAYAGLSTGEQLNKPQINRFLDMKDALYENVVFKLIELIPSGRSQDATELSKIRETLTDLEAVYGQRSESRVLESSAPETFLTPEARLLFDGARQKAMPLRWESLGGTEFLVRALTQLLGETIYSERAGILTPELEDIFRKHLGEGRVVTTPAFDQALEAAAGAQGRILMDQAWIEKFILHSPRALYVLLKSLHEVTRDKPLLAVLGDDISQKIKKAMEKRGDEGDRYDQNNLTIEEKIDAQKNLMPKLKTLITFVSPQEVPEYMEDNEFGVTALIAHQESVPVGLEGSSFALDPAGVEATDLMAVAFMMPSLLKGASLIRDIPDASERIQKLQENMEEIFPGASRQGQAFVIDLTEYIANKLITGRLVDIAA